MIRSVYFSTLALNFKTTEMEELKFNKEIAEGLYRIFCGLSRNVYKYAEVYEEAKPNMEKAYEKVLQWGEKNCDDMHGRKLHKEKIELKDWFSYCFTSGWLRQINFEEWWNMHEEEIKSIIKPKYSQIKQEDIFTDNFKKTLEEKIIKEFKKYADNNADEAIKILEQYNQWRRGEIDKLNYSPTEIGLAIDIVTQGK